MRYVHDLSGLSSKPIICWYNGDTFYLSTGAQWQLSL